MAHPLHALDEAELTQGEPAPALPRHRAAATAISILAGLTIVVDVALTKIALPSPLGHAAVAATIGPWVLYLQARSLCLLRRRMGAVEWADGFVHGVSRRTPPNERTRWMSD